MGLHDPERFTPVILERMTEILMAEYETRFFAAYGRAVSAQGNQRPIEPADEVRNAFDHFSLATREALVIDGRAVPPDPREWQVAPDGSSPRKGPTDPKERALLDVEQALRHLAIGRYYCCQHQIVGLTEQIDRAIRALDDDVRQAKEPLRKRAKEIDVAFQNLTPIDIQGIYSRPEIESWLRDLETKIEALTESIVEMGSLLLDIVAPPAANPS